MKKKAFVFKVGEFFSGFFLYANIIISKILHIYNEKVHMTKDERKNMNREEKIENLKKVAKSEHGDVIQNILENALCLEMV